MKNIKEKLRDNNKGTELNQFIVEVCGQVRREREREEPEGHVSQEFFESSFNEVGFMPILRF